jgi:predicted ATPase
LRRAAEEVFQTALGIAKQQGARSLGLRAALSLAKLYQSIDRLVEAHDVLAPALEGFAPAPEMPEIAEAQALLAVLAETAEVKAQASRHQQRRYLHVAYGNALIAARGYGAIETMEAFARARESSSGDQDVPERLAADYGLWAGSYIRGELAAMRERAAAFLRDAEARPDSPEAGVAHRAAGITHWFAGEYREARVHLERALGLFQPGRDDDLAFRFGQDPGAAAMLHLAIVSWPLGEVDRAFSLVERAQERIQGLAHIGSQANGQGMAASFELICGNVSRIAPKVAELVRLAREHDLRMWGAYAVFLEGLTKVGGGESADGLAQMRRGAAILHEQKVLALDGLWKTALAEAEARAGDVDRALTVLNQGLVASEQSGHHAFDSELRRTRGEMLLKHHPADTAGAEESLQAAIAVAKQQGTRSFELRAAITLAKLCQSTGRHADAHAVLAPALEGFAPTPEMPEIAEALALMERLA